MINIKGVFICVVMFAAIVSFSLFLPQKNDETYASDYLRIHIRANSNSKIDQEVKYKVKDKIVETLTPLLSNALTKQDAVNIVNNNISLIEQTANGVLKNNNFSYVSKAQIKSEYFPTRTYESLTLSGDVYDALIVELGNAKGDNWWCVVYPPMCFVPSTDNSTNIVYKSKILEIIKNFFR